MDFVMATAVDTHFIAVIHKDPESGYGVSFPDLPGIIAVADTLDAALDEAGVALSFALEDWQGPRPLPRTLEELRAEPWFREETRDAVVAAVRPQPHRIAAQ